MANISEPSTRRPARPLLVFDGDCGICTKLATFARRRVPLPHGRIVASQDVDLEHYGLTAQQCDEALQLVTAEGTYAAQDAVARLLLASHLWWRPLGVVLLLPGVNFLAGVVYRWVARNRSRLPGGTPACALPARAATDRTPEAS